MIASTIPDCYVSHLYLHFAIVFIFIFEVYICINNIRLLHLYLHLVFVSVFVFYIHINNTRLLHLYLHLVHSCICNCIDFSMISSVMQFKKGSFEVKTFSHQNHNITHQKRFLSLFKFYTNSSEKNYKKQTKFKSIVKHLSLELHRLFVAARCC